MPGANADRGTIAYKEESVWGVTPASPQFQLVRLTGETLKQDTTTVESEEIDAGRQTSDFVRVGIRANGSTSHEFSAGTYDDWLRASLFSAGWSSPVVVGPITTISAASADNSINDSANGFGSIVVGQWVQVTGFVTNGTVFFGKVVSKTTAKVVLSHCVLVNEAAGPAVTVNMGGQIINGVTPVSFSQEREHTDLANEFVNWVGQMVSGFNFSVTKDAILKIGFDWLGKKEVSTTSTLSTGGAKIAAPTGGVFNAIDDVKAIFENGVRADFTDWGLNFSNNLRERMVIGTLGLESVGAGRVKLEGTSKAFYSTKSRTDKYLNFTTSPWAIAMYKAAKGYIFEIPSTKFSKGERVLSGLNTDVMEDLAFTGFKDATALMTLRIARFV